jgi:hypothetical protein
LSIAENELIPLQNRLEQNYPNPLNPSTEIKYSVKDDGIVQLRIFNMLGQEVKTLLNEYRTAGNYSVRFDAVNLASGVYFYQLESGEFSEIKKMILIR